ncbi:MAG: RHS repeat-associated core domain-containing protein [Spirochaetales bacterium]|nr:RHS repeat-associated core domain-containing protein [Spirochaetales bacterium]
MESSFSGLYYYNARWYDPNIGRFTTEDPIRSGLNWYAYANNNPLKFVDPTGLEFVVTIETGVSYTYDSNGDGEYDLTPFSGEEYDNTEYCPSESETKTYDTEEEAKNAMAEKAEEVRDAGKKTQQTKDNIDYYFSSGKFVTDTKTVVVDGITLVEQQTSKYVRNYTSLELKETDEDSNEKQDKKDNDQSIPPDADSSDTNSKNDSKNDSKNGEEN